MWQKEKTDSAPLESIVTETLALVFKLLIRNVHKCHLEALLHCCAVQFVLSGCPIMKLSVFISFFNSNNHLGMGN